VHEPDVPSPIDLCNRQDAIEWERAAQARPGRAQMFQAFSAQLLQLGRSDLSVLELGSGPGFLAAALLESLPDLELSLLDFSLAMHDLARTRLAGNAARIVFIHRSFKDPTWTDDLPRFDAVITNQAVHELRHKRYATALHSQVLRVLKPGAPYIVCDHHCGEGGMSNNQLFMSLDEHRQSLCDAGFRQVEQILRAGSLVMHRAA
jgi:ubiquinone/menaquinone biosynthesis C-methylase UbiE